jgi:hypothetical protein
VGPFFSQKSRRRRRRKIIFSLSLSHSKQQRTATVAFKGHFGGGGGLGAVCPSRFTRYVTDFQEDIAHVEYL